MGNKSSHVHKQLSSGSCWQVVGDWVSSWVILSLIPSIRDKMTHKQVDVVVNIQFKLAYAQV